MNNITDIIITRFKNEYCNYKIEEYNISKFKRVLVIEDSSVFYITIDPDCKSMYEMRKEYVNEGIVDLVIEEITYNEINIRFNFSEFKRKLENLGIKEMQLSCIKYKRFDGYNNSEYSKWYKLSSAQYINLRLPKLKIKKRISIWNGIKHNIIIFKIQGKGKIDEYAIGCTEYSSQDFILKIAKYLAENNYKKISSNGIPPQIGNRFFLKGSFCNNDFPFYKMCYGRSEKDNYFSLEKHLNYYIFSKNFKDQKSVITYCKKLLNRVYNNNNNIEWESYIKPKYKWKSEELTYRIIEKLYGNYGVVYQHRPFYLKSSKGGQLSYDIYISKFKIAIEYQGKQHFESVEFFGGEESFLEVKKRDEEKRFISEQNNVKLIYINYWEEVTEKLIRQKIAYLIDN